jgi:phage shock protein PspC (stress-responsive transcriptional regulator)
MKKNISINISGIIFHIEEDGYDQLKEYLESINRYFSAFDDSHEIIADIESRIAELFLAKLKEGKQIIGIEDVEELIATMGSIKDFQAAEEDSGYAVAPQKETKREKTDDGEPLFSKKLYRDNNRKLLGGVLSGIAFYFTIDPLWIRLLYALLFFGISILPSIAGFLLIAYIVMWIVIPGSDDLKEVKKIKKMYRDPDGKVLGGVASGISAYFGVDVVIIRLLFFAGIFMAGTGLILYIILWIILPEAKTLTDKMEMQGQPVTLSNIESNIKKSLNVEGGEENILVKVLLFPFRLIATLFEFLSKALGPFMSFIVEAIRVVFGVLLAIVGISGVLAVLIVIGVVIGLFAGGDLNIMYPIPFDIIKNDLTIIPGIALSLALIIPFFFLAILGFMVIMKKKVLNAKTSWSILAMWFLSIAVLSFTIPSYVNNFSEQGRHIVVNRYALADKIVKLELNDIGENEFDLVSLRIRSHEDAEIKLEQEFTASGKTRQEATDNAKSILYGIEVSDSVFRFDSNLKFAQDAKFRRQELKMTLFMPIGQKFMLGEEMKNLIGSFLYREGFSNRQITDNIWQFGDDGLICATCPEEINEQASSDDFEAWDITGYQRNYEIEDFTDIEINSPLNVKIKRGDHFSVIANGKKSAVDDVVFDKTGQVLSINYKGKMIKSDKTRDEVKIYIIVPHVVDLEFGGAAKVIITGFKEDYVDIHLTGAASLDINVEVTSMVAKIEGASKLDIHGQGDRMEVAVLGASRFNGFDYNVSELQIETHSASTAHVFAQDLLQIKTHGASSVVYKGDAKVEIEKSGNSSVRKY